MCQQFTGFCNKTLLELLIFISVIVLTECNLEMPKLSEIVAYTCLCNLYVYKLPKSTSM